MVLNNSFPRNPFCSLAGNAWEMGTIVLRKTPVILIEVLLVSGEGEINVVQSDAQGTTRCQLGVAVLWSSQ